MKVICTVQHEKKKAENKLNMACSLDCDKEEVEHGLYTVQVLTEIETHLHLLMFIMFQIGLAENILLDFQNFVTLSLDPILSVV